MAEQFVRRPGPDVGTFEYVLGRTGRVVAVEKQIEDKITVNYYGVMVMTEREFDQLIVHSGFDTDGSIAEALALGDN